jgi:hypothetical protein
MAEFSSVGIATGVKKDGRVFTIRPNGLVCYEV